MGIDGGSRSGRSAFAHAVRRVVASTAPGECLSYGDVAREAGWPGAARAVGRVLATSEGLPWWRVVRADGTVPKGERQVALLAGEGVAVVDGRVTWP